MESGDDALAMNIATHGFDETFEHCIKRRTAVTHLPDPLAVGKTLFGAGTAQGFQLRLAEHGEKLV